LPAFVNDQQQPSSTNTHPVSLFHTLCSDIFSLLPLLLLPLLLLYRFLGQAASSVLPIICRPVTQS